MKRRPLVSQGTFSRMFQEAAEAWKKQEYSESLQILERASKLDPSNPSILLDLGRGYGMRYDFAQAERCFDKAVRAAPHKAQVLAEAGRRCQEFGNYGLALRYFTRASGESHP